MAKATNKYKQALLDIINIMADNDYVDVECYGNRNTFVKDNVFNADVSYKDEVAKILEKYNLVAEDFTHISSERSEGSGDFDGYEVVLRVKDEIYMFEGYYSSWNGTEMEWDDCYQVEEVEKTITVYEKMK